MVLSSITGGGLLVYLLQRNDNKPKQFPYFVCAKNIINAELEEDALKNKKVNLYNDYKKTFNDFVFDKDKLIIHFLEGEAGVGKSTFIAEIANEQRKKGRDVAFIKGKKIENKSLKEVYTGIFTHPIDKSILDPEMVLKEIDKLTKNPLIVIIDDFQLFMPKLVGDTPEAAKKYENDVIAFKSMINYCIIISREDYLVKFIFVASDASCYCRVEELLTSTYFKRLELPILSEDKFIEAATVCFGEEKKSVYKEVVKLTRSFKHLEDILETMKTKTLNDAIKEKEKQLGELCPKYNDELKSEGIKLYEEFLKQNEKANNIFFPTTIQNEKMLKYLMETNLFSFINSSTVKPKSMLALNTFKRLVDGEDFHKK